MTVDTTNHCSKGENPPHSSRSGFNSKIGKVKAEESKAVGVKGGEAAVIRRHSRASSLDRREIYQKYIHTDRCVHCARELCCARQLCCVRQLCCAVHRCAVNHDV